MKKLWVPAIADPHPQRPAINRHPISFQRHPSFDDLGLGDRNPFHFDPNVHASIGLNLSISDLNFFHCHLHGRPNQPN